MAVSADEMYLLTLLTYAGNNGIGTSRANDMTIGEIAQIMSDDNYLKNIAETENAGRAQEIQTLCSRILDPQNTHLSEMIVKDSRHLGNSEDQKCFCVVSADGKDGTVVFQGTQSMKEWKDNFEAPFVDGRTPCQDAALDWYNSPEVQSALSGCENIYTTGHSKGGNNAKIVAIFEPRVTECVSFDGQGFSDNFLEKYSSEIATAQHKITTYSNEYDYVNILLNDVGEMKYIHPNDSQQYQQGFYTHDLFALDQRLPLSEHATGERGPVANALSELFNSYLRSNAQNKHELLAFVGESIGNWDLGKSINNLLTSKQNQKGLMEFLSYVKKYVATRGEEALSALDCLLPGISDIYRTIEKVMNTEVLGKTIEQWLLSDPTWLIREGINTILDLLEKMGFDVELARLYTQMIAGNAFGYLEVNTEYGDRVIEGIDSGAASADIGAPVLRVNFNELQNICIELNGIVTRLSEASEEAIKAADYCDQCRIEPSIASISTPFHILEKIIDMFTPAGYLKGYAKNLKRAAEKTARYRIAIQQVAAAFDETEKKLATRN